VKCVVIQTFVKWKPTLFIVKVLSSRWFFENNDESKQKLKQIVSKLFKHTNIILRILVLKDRFIKL